MSVLRPPLKRVMASASVIIVGALACFQTLLALMIPIPDGTVAEQAEGAQVALWWMAYAAVKAARIYEYKPLIPVSPVPEGNDQ